MMMGTILLVEVWIVPGSAILRKAPRLERIERKLLVQSGHPLLYFHINILLRNPLTLPTIHSHHLLLITEFHQAFLPYL